LSTPSSLRCIHYSQNRALSPREGARIQSFPDWFNFFGGKDSVTTQIGNAVPPLLALEMSKQIEKFLKKEIEHE
jgi:DNA (cytosine-5)-methyltransferase 1